MNAKRLNLLVLLSGLLLVQPICAQKKTKSSRKPSRYKKYGKLLPGDFRGRPPAGKSILAKLDALSVTELLYGFDYKYKVVNRRWTIRITRVKPFARFDRARSWNQQPGNRRLLEHEQGHFDITQGQGLRAVAEIAVRMKRNPIIGRGSSRSIAKKRAQLRLDVLMKPYLDELPKLHKEYDRITSHGTKFAEQNQQRLNQRLLIKKYRQGITETTKQKP